VSPEGPDDPLRRKVKGELRKRMRGVRQALPATAREARSSRIVERLLALPVLATARAVALFWPMLERGEVDLRPLDATLRARGLGVAYPCVAPGTSRMTFRLLEDPAKMVERGLGFCEPPGEAAEAPPGALDLIVVPALVVDPSGHRIGYGAGFYDRTLPAFSPPAATASVAYDFQLLAEIPATPGDFPVGWVVTDARTIDVLAEKAKGSG